MATINYTISFDLGAKMDLMGAVNAQVMPLVSQAVQGIAKHTASQWQESVLRAKLWSVEKDNYAQSIKWHMTGDLSAVIETDYRYAQEIESGRPARDLKRMLDSSHKVRRTEDGRRFLVIPFRHNTPGNTAHGPAMPSGVGAIAAALAASRVTKTSERASGEVTKLSPKTGMHPAAKQTPFASHLMSKGQLTVAKRSYAWGDRISNAMLKQAGMDQAARKRYAGMVKMDTTTPGGKKSSSYMTFRVMIENSKGWIVPAQPGLYLAKKVADDMAPKAEAAFGEAIKRTIKG